LTGATLEGTSFQVVDWYRRFGDPVGSIFSVAGHDSHWRPSTNHISSQNGWLAFTLSGYI